MVFLMIQRAKNDRLVRRALPVYDNENFLVACLSLFVLRLQEEPSYGVKFCKSLEIVKLNTDQAHKLWSALSHFGPVSFRPRSLRPWVISA